MKYPHMFAPLEIRGVRLKNRILALELPDRTLDDGSGELTQSLIDNYEMLARGGVAAVTVSQELMQPQNARQRENLLILTEALRCHGAVAAYRCVLDPSRMTETLAVATVRAAAAVSVGCRMLIVSGLFTPDSADADPVDSAASALKALRVAAGPHVILALTLDCPEKQLEDYVKFAAMIETNIDMLIVHAELPSTEFDDHGLVLPLCERFKAALRIPVAAAGGFNEPHQIENAMLAGQCDFVAMSRQLFADPQFVRKTAELREGEIIPCLRCGLCEADAMPNEPFQCTVNPRARREARLARIEPVTRPKKVLVVGGGPAGMYAALTAAQRGHTVRLAEKENRLGGMLWYAGENSRKTDLRRLRDSLIARVEASGAEICTGKAVGREYIEKYAPDAVILAIGTEPTLSPIPGMAVFARHALWAYAEPDKVGKTVVIIGGGLTGLECALHLAQDGERSITVIESSPDWAHDAYPAQRAAIERALSPNISIKTGVRCTEVRPGGIVYRARNNRRVELSADTVLYAVGMQPRRAELAELLTAHPNTAVIGDCREPGRLLQALRDGLFAAYDI